jgi:hypothetical protein
VHVVDAIEGWADYGRYAAALDPLHHLHEDQVTALIGQSLSHGRPGSTGDWPMRSLLSAGGLRWLSRAGQLAPRDLTALFKEAAADDWQGGADRLHPLMPAGSAKGRPDLLLVTDDGVLIAVVENKVSASISRRQGVACKAGQLCEYVMNVAAWRSGAVPDWASGLHLKLPANGAVSFIVLAARDGWDDGHGCTLHSKEWVVLQYESWLDTLDAVTGQAEGERRLHHFLVNLLVDCYRQVNGDPPGSLQSWDDVQVSRVTLDRLRRAVGLQDPRPEDITALRAVQFWCRDAERHSVSLGGLTPSRHEYLRFSQEYSHARVAFGSADFGPTSRRGHYPLNGPLPGGLLVVLPKQGDDARLAVDELVLLSGGWLSWEDIADYQRSLEALRSLEIYQAGYSHDDIRHARLARFQLVDSVGPLSTAYSQVLKRLKSTLDLTLR